MSFASSPDNAGNPRPLHSPALEELIPKRNITDDVLRCIGCILGRAEEGATINPPDIKTCAALERTSVINVLDDLKRAGIVEPFKPDSYPKLLGKRNPQRTTHLRPTEFGATLLGAAVQPDCPARNPLISLTNEQARIIRCIRCMLARTARTEETEGTIDGIISIPQMARCLEKSADSVDHDLRKLLKIELLEKTAVYKKRWGASNPDFYTPTSEGAKWLTPALSATCPSLDLESPLLEGASPTQKRVLGCISCLHNSRKPDDPENLLRPLTISKCTSIDKSIVRKVFEALGRRGEVTIVPVSEELKLRSGHSISHYQLTADGIKLVRAVRVTAECPSGRIQPIRSAEVTRITEDGLETRTPAAIINELPTETFKNGAQFLEYLSTTYCGSSALIDIVAKALATAGRKKAQKYPGHIEDIVQDVIIEIGVRDKEIVFPKEMALLYTIVYRRVIDFQRVKNRESNRLHSFDSEDDRTIDTLGTPFSEDKVVTQVDDARHNLLRSVLQRRDFKPIETAILEATALGSEEGGLIAEIADRFGKTPGNVRVIKHRLFKKIQQDLQDYSDN